MAVAFGSGKPLRGLGWTGHNRRVPEMIVRVRHGSLAERLGANLGSEIRARPSARVPSELAK